MTLGLTGAGLTSAATPFDITTIPSLKEWWDPTTIVAADSSQVASFAGRQAFLTLLQGTAAQRPLYRTAANGINGVPALQFDGTLANLGVSTDWGGTQTGFTFIAVAKLTALGSFPMVAVWSAARYELRFNAATGKPQWIADSSGGATTGVIDGTNRLNTPVVLTGWFNDATDTGQLWVNGVSAGTYSETHVIRTAADTFSLGDRPGGTLFFTGLIGDVLVCSAGISTSDRQGAERTLGAKYGITVA